ncbi:MAG: acyl--CoA ligase [Myxococcaceae bacterium]|nr:acyl--CoA ligase [Myxococcaceae bacterium]
MSAPALVTSQGEAWPRERLSAEVATLAGTLRALGAGPGVVVAARAPTPAKQVVTALACLDAGAVLFPLDASMPVLAQERLLARARPHLVVTDTAVRAEKPREALDARAGLLLFTSGSSGEPKGVVLSRAGLDANVDGILSYLPVREFPRTAVVLSLGYSYALVGQVLTTLRAGGTVLLCNDLPTPAAQWEAMLAHGAQGLSSVPFSLRRLAQAARAGGHGEQLRYVAAARGALDRATALELAQTFPRARRYNQYGLTEAAPRVAAIGDDDPGFAQGAAGRPLPGVEVWAESPEGVRLGPRGKGELYVRGPSVMLGYLDDPRGTAQVLRPDGALRAGDSGWLDERGLLFVEGRSDGVVKCAGERVHAQEVARVLREATGLELAVVARPHPEWGHRLRVFYEAPDGARTSWPQAVKALTWAARPYRFDRVPALPRTPQGKHDLAALEALASVD